MPAGRLASQVYLPVQCMRFGSDILKAAVWLNAEDMEITGAIDLEKQVYNEACSATS